MDLEALRGISVDDGEEGPAGSRGRIVSVVHAQVDHDTGGALLHEGLELGRHTDRTATPGEVSQVDRCSSLNTAEFIQGFTNREE